MTPDDKDALKFIGYIAGWSLTCFIAGGLAAIIIL
jgi:hypothetical protein